MPLNGLAGMIVARFAAGQYAVIGGVKHLLVSRRRESTCLLHKAMQTLTRMTMLMAANVEQNLPRRRHGGAGFPVSR